MAGLSCSSCNSSVTNGQQLCDGCGNDLSQSNACQRCSNELDTDSKFCKSCGYQRGDSTSIESVPKYVRKSGQNQGVQQSVLAMPLRNPVGFLAGCGIISLIVFGLLFLSCIGFWGIL